MKNIMCASTASMGRQSNTWSGRLVFTQLCMYTCSGC